MQALSGRETMTRDQDNIARRAHDLLQAAGATREPVSLVDVVSSLNLSLIRAAREPFQSEAALVPLGDSHAIVLRGSGDERRRRFTIAHEIGHFVLHTDRVAPERGGKVNQAGRAQEREADAFAAELLMPEHLVRQAVLEVGADSVRLAGRFEVSEQAMSVRLRRLGLAARQSELLPPSRDAL
jgi:IrrE N-terminal-like domain